MELKISNKGQVIIPAELRRKYKLHSGVLVNIVDYGGVLAIVPALKEPAVKQAAGILRGGSSLTKTLLNEHKQEQ